MRITTNLEPSEQKVTVVLCLVCKLTDSNEFEKKIKHIIVLQLKRVSLLPYIKKDML